MYHLNRQSIPTTTNRKIFNNSTNIKLVISLALVLTFNLNLLGQQEIPNSKFNISTGYGQSYGGSGIKTVTGYKNSGLLIGFGYFAPEIIGYKLGCQLSANNLYMELGYGTVNIIKPNNRSIEDIEGFSMTLGGMYGFGFENRIFLDFGIGSNIVTQDMIYDFISIKSIYLNFGLGYRFGTKVKKTETIQT